MGWSNKHISGLQLMESDEVLVGKSLGSSKSYHDSRLCFLSARILDDVFALMV